MSERIVWGGMSWFSSNKFMKALCHDYMHHVMPYWGLQNLMLLKS